MFKKLRKFITLFVLGTFSSLFIFFGFVRPVSASVSYTPLTYTDLDCFSTSYCNDPINPDMPFTSAYVYSFSCPYNRFSYNCYYGLIYQISNTAIGDKSIQLGLVCSNLYVNKVDNRDYLIYFLYNIATILSSHYLIPYDYYTLLTTPNADNYVSFSVYGNVSAGTPVFYNSYGTSLSSSLVSALAGYSVDISSQVSDFTSDISLWNSSFNIEVNKVCSFYSSYDESFSTGFNSGFDAGYADGYYVGSAFGYSTGYDTGYDIGYDTGYNDAENAESPQMSFVSLLSSIFTFPYDLVKTAFDVDLFGVNISALILGIFALSLSFTAIALIKRLFR